MKFRSVAALAVLCCSAAPVFAQGGLSHVQLLALQQQLRDDGCGLQHVTGRMDATTRRAIRQCDSKYSVTSASPSALLTAMNIGFGPNDNPPTGNGMRGGMNGNGMNGSAMGTGMRRGARGSRGTSARRGMNGRMNGMSGDSSMMNGDSTRMRRGVGRGTGMRRGMGDSTMTRDSNRVRRGMRRGAGRDTTMRHDTTPF